MPVTGNKTGKKTRKNARKTNLLRLYNRMTKLTSDAVDNEIVKRFKILIDASEEDLPKIEIDTLLNDHNNIDTHAFPEGLQPYVKHYIFMVKRENNIKAKKEAKNES
ncbi:MAG: hypothetical protein WDA74_05800 [Spirochaetota bacterium]